MSRKRRGSKRPKTRAGRARKPAPGTGPERLDVDLDQLHAILARARMNDDDRKVLAAAVDTLATLTELLEHNDATIEKLRKLLFGSSSEKTRDVLNEPAGGGDDDASDDDGNNDAGGDDSSPADASDKNAPDKKKRKGQRIGQSSHGR